MTLKFTTAGEVSVSGGVKCLVYAGAGVGKTVLMSTLPNPVMISAESGALSLKQANLERIWGVGTKDITYNMPIIEVATVDDFTEAYRWCTQAKEANNFQSIGLDSISEIAEVVLNNAKRQVKDPRQAYGELIEKMETLIRAFRDLPGKHVCMASKMEPNKDALTGVVRYGPSMPGSKLGDKLPYFFDEVMRLGVNKTPEGVSYRFLQTQPDLQYEAKDRSGALAPVEYPHMGAVISKIMGA